MKEKNSKNKKIGNSSRQRYFQMVLYLSLSGSKLNLRTKNIIGLIELLVTSKFISQSRLEKALFNLIVKDRGRLIFLKDFNGQLECNLEGIPYWNVYLQTSALTTSRCIAKSVSKELFKTKNTIDSTIKIHPLSKFKRCQREKLFSIPNSAFYPGYFSWVTLKFLELLKTDQVKKTIEETPEKYHILIDRMNNLDKSEKK